MDTEKAYAPTRNATTEAEYLYRANLLLDHYAFDTGQTWQEHPMGVVPWAAALRPHIRKATWRKYKASLIFFMAENGPIEVVEGLRALKQTPCLPRKRGGRTGAQKLKRFPKADLERVIHYLSDGRENRWDSLLRLWLVAGLLTGLRPSEWFEAEWIEKDGEACLKVKNAKYSNQRALGPYRTLHLGQLHEAQQRLIGQFLMRIQAEPDFGAAYRCTRFRLHWVVRHLWPRRKQFPTLYSCRHQFAANAKAMGLSRVEVAALMGHATDETASREYGRRRAGDTGHGGQGFPWPDPEDLARVREVADSRMSLWQRYQ